LSEELTEETLAATIGGRAPTELRIDRGDIVGRYVVLETLGQGGMGVVFAAYDPELDRKVALKLLHGQARDQSKASEGHKRLLREAQAMARLSHPNVIAVHDVGEHRDRIFLAMEFVDGTTLRGWLDRERPTWRETVEVFRAAGRGLAAAHEKGLVHRDFKPDNVMIGEDGRVRVMDFGLARSERDRGIEETGRVELDDPGDLPDVDAFATVLTRQGGIVGTPGYMAPEQWTSAETSAKTDQFSFCVALYEALYGQRPFPGETGAALAFNVSEGNVIEPESGAGVPAWLRRVVLRGLSPQPSERHPGMAELLAKLGAAEALKRRNRLIAAIAVLGLGTAAIVGYQQLQHDHLIESCVADAATIDAVWNDSARQGLREALLANQVGYAETTADKVLPWLEGWADAWRSTREETCRAMRVEARYDASAAAGIDDCLAERLWHFETLVEELSTTDEKVLRKAITAAAGLPSVTACADLRYVESRTALDEHTATEEHELRKQLARANNLRLAGKYDEGITLAQDALERAEAAGFSGSVAAARLDLGRLLEKKGDYGRAESELTRAYVDASLAQMAEVAADAATALVVVTGDRQAHHGEGRAWDKAAAVAIAAIEPGEGARTAARLNNLAVVLNAMGEADQARSVHERALAIREKALGPTHPDVAKCLNNLATVRLEAGQWDAAKELHRRALTIRRESLGSGHPDVGATLVNSANVHAATGNFEEAKRLYEEALGIWTDALGTEHPTVAIIYNNLANVHLELGDRAAAKELYEDNLAILEKLHGPDHPGVAVALNNLAVVSQQLGDGPAAEGYYERTLQIMEARYGPDHPDVATPLGNLGSLMIWSGDQEDGIRLLERAIAIYDAHDGVQEGELVARFGLAEALIKTKGGRVRALAQARLARDGYEASGEGRAEELAAVEKWLAAQ
jgi:tetratricopeptide (TPR) repeat protein/predicted Ser/Thr protein kinase